MKHDSCYPFPGAVPDVRIAGTRRELTGAFELVYRCYAEKGYIDPHPGRVVYQPAFGLPSSRTIVATGAKGVIGTLTVVGDNRLGLKMETTYPAEVQSLREQGRSVAEITCLAIRPLGEFRPMAVFFALTRLMVHYAYSRRYDDLLLAIHPRHQRFYWRCFRVFPLGPCRPYPFVSGSPSICCRVDLRNLSRNVDPETWQQYFGKELPEAHYSRPPITPADHRYFCSRSGIVWDTDSDGRSTGDEGKDAA